MSLWIYHAYKKQVTSWIVEVEDILTIQATPNELWIGSRVQATKLLKLYKYKK